MRQLMIIGLMSLSTAWAAQYPLPDPGVDVIGELQIAYAGSQDTMLDIGRRYGTGFDEMGWANPGVSNWVPGETTPIIIPTQHILPAGPRTGIVLNIPEMRVYFYPKNQNVVYSYPVSVGRMDWKTPLGTSRVTAKQTDPAWYPPESIRREHLADGRGVLPKVVPAGPNNPLGQHVLRLSLPSYLLHGTNNPDGIGMRVTHGCMRFYPEDIAALYDMVPVGTPVTLTNQPVKIGWNGQTLLMEVHPPLDEDNLTSSDIVRKAHELLARYQNEKIELADWAVIDTAAEQMSGVPVDIGRMTAGFSPSSNTYETILIPEQTFDSNSSANQ